MMRQTPSKAQHSTPGHIYWWRLKSVAGIPNTEDKDGTLTWNTQLPGYLAGGGD